MIVFRNILVFLLLLGCFNAISQKNLTTIADQAFKDMQYSTAIEKYKEAVKKIKKNKVEQNRVLFQLGECYRKTNNTKQAEVTYKRLITANFQKSNPIVLLYYADVLKKNQKYTDAAIYYKQYLVLVPEDVMGKIGLESCKDAQEWINTGTPYEIRNEKKLNSEKDDWCPIFADKKFKSIVFSSQRNGATGKGLDNWTGENFTDLFLSNNRKGNWNSADLYEAENIINTPANEGPVSFNKNYSTAYFTRCGVEKKQQLGCQIYKTSRKGRSWEKPEIVRLGPDSFDFVHAAISENELTIYFVSNMPGGYGDLDIWMAKRNKKSETFGEAVNLGPKINTSYKEAFITLFSDSIIYFSSTGHLGMGGYDLFSSQMIKGKWQTPENLKSPMNSSYDDFGICFYETIKRGYFTSNRPGGTGGDDIYYFNKPEAVFALQVKTIDEKTSKNIITAKIKIIGSNGTSYEKETDKNGIVSFDKTNILKNVSYQIIASKTNYFNNTASFNTIDMEWSKDFDISILLTPIEKKPIVLPEILFDLAKWDLKPQYQDSLIGLAKTLIDNPEVVIELMAHTDSRDNDENNLMLSQKRAESVVGFLISKGIDSARFVAKGYGESGPRIMDKDIIKDGFSFKKGSILNEAYINAISDNKQKETAHQLNRRIEFRILRNDYKTGEKPNPITTVDLNKDKQPEKPQPLKDKKITTPEYSEKYTIQVGDVTTNIKMFEKLKGVKRCTDTEGTFIYCLGQFNSIEEADNYNINVSKAGVNGSPIIFDENKYNCIDLASIKFEKTTPKKPIIENNYTGKYTIQLGVGNINPKTFSKLKGVKKCVSNDGAVLFTIGIFNSKEEAIKFNKNVANMGYKASEIPFDENIYNCSDIDATTPQPNKPQSNVNEADKKYTIQIGTGTLDKKLYSKLKGIRKCIGADGITRYILGEFNSKAEAEAYNKNVSNLGYKGWVAEVDQNRINCTDF